MPDFTPLPLDAMEEPCAYCNGQGWVEGVGEHQTEDGEYIGSEPIQQECPACHGNGKAPVSQPPDSLDRDGEPEPVPSWSPNGIEPIIEDGVRVGTHYLGGRTGPPPRSCPGEPAAIQPAHCTDRDGEPCERCGGRRRITDPYRSHGSALPCPGCPECSPSKDSEGDEVLPGLPKYGRVDKWEARHRRLEQSISEVEHERDEIAIDPKASKLLVEKDLTATKLRAQRDSRLTKEQCREKLTILHNGPGPDRDARYQDAWRHGVRDAQDALRVFSDHSPPPKTFSLEECREKLFREEVIDEGDAALVVEAEVGTHLVPDFESGLRAAWTAAFGEESADA